MSYLNRFGLCDSDICKWCEVADTPEHVLYYFWKYVKQRVKMLSELAELGVRLDVREICRRSEALVVFNEIIAKIGRIQEEQQIHELD